MPQARFLVRISTTLRGKVKITEVNYMFPKPGPDSTPVAKISLVTKVGDLGCGVGYYK
jgi:hypothetical protein